VQTHARVFIGEGSTGGYEDEGELEMRDYHVPIFILFSYLERKGYVNDLP
jgi:hypothetical protein